MSRYLNPKGISKEAWCFDNGFLMMNPFQLNDMNRKGIEENTNRLLDLLAEGATKEFKEEDGNVAFFNRYAIVDMINNGKFRAAAVYTSRDEVIKNTKAFINDPRQHLWFMVKKNKALAEVRPFIS